jgi:dTDP-4-dehydrorhamnose reductase
VKILLFGGSGQLGFELRKRAHDLDFEVVSPVTSEVNISEREQVIFLAKTVRPAVIINAAAYTAVDKAEVEQDAAYKVNRDGARNAALAAKEADCRLIHISTDYVFDGLLGRPLKEDDLTNPLSVYGASKLAGELEVSEILRDRSLICRTSSLHGQKGINFVHTMIKLFKDLDVVRVVSDQTMSPTWAGWLAEAILDLARLEVSGVVHASCDGAVSWHRFAQAILARVEHKIDRAGKVTIEETSAADLKRPARRPHYSPFDVSKIGQILGRPPISWEEGLEGHLRDIGLGPEV